MLNTLVKQGPRVPSSGWLRKARPVPTHRPPGPVINERTGTRGVWPCGRKVTWAWWRRQQCQPRATICAHKSQLHSPWSQSTCTGAVAGTAGTAGASRRSRRRGVCGSRGPLRQCAGSMVTVSWQPFKPNRVPSTHRVNTARRRLGRCGSCSCNGWRISYNAAGQRMATLGCWLVGKVTLSLPAGHASASRITRCQVCAAPPAYIRTCMRLSMSLHCCA